MSKIVKTILPIASIALPVLLPGIGTALGTALGLGTTALGTGLASAATIGGNALLGAGLSGIGTAVGGGSVGSSLKSALLGGVTGGLAGGGGSALASATGLTGTGAKIASGALTGAAVGGSTGGDLKSALTGAVMGGAGGGLFSGSEAASGLGQEVALTGETLPASSTLGSLTSGTGLASGGGLSSLTGGSTMGLKDALNLGSTIYSGLSSQAANDEIRKALLASQEQAATTLSPYTTAGATATTQLSDALSAGFDAGDLASDKGYQFQLQQGEEALQRALSSQGLSQSGAALKAAQEYGQGLASTSYNDAYNRWLAENSQLQSLSNTGSTAATNLASIFGNIGNINGATTAAKTDSSNQMVSSILNSNLLKEALLKGAGLFS